MSDRGGDIVVFVFPGDTEPTVDSVLARVSDYSGHKEVRFYPVADHDEMSGILQGIYTGPGTTYMNFVTRSAPAESKKLIKNII